MPPITRVKYPAKGKVRKKPKTFPHHRKIPATNIMAPKAIRRVLMVGNCPTQLLAARLKKWSTPIYY